MSTVAQLIDRIHREWLTAADEIPTRFTLAAEIATVDATSFTYDDDLLSPEEEELLGPGTVVEFDRELIQVGAVNEDTNVCSDCLRGVLGTTAATHASGTVGVIAPKWPRQNTFDAVADAVVGLWPDLYRVVQDSSRSFSATAHTEVPATVMQPLWVWARPSGVTSYSQYPVELYDEFAGSSTGKAVYVPGLIDGAAGYMVYKAKFARPTAESDDLTATIGLNQEWEQLVAVDAVAYLLAGKDLSPVEQRFLSEQLAAQGFPVMSAGRIRDSLLRYSEFLRARFKRAERGRYQTPVVTNAPW